jgi:hypothetical protein
MYVGAVLPMSVSVFGLFSVTRNTKVSDVTGGGLHHVLEKKISKLFGNWRAVL